MIRVIILWTLLILIYQFDELVKVAYLLIAKLAGVRPRNLALGSDFHVGTALALAGMPLALNYLLVFGNDLTKGFLIIAVMFLAVVLAEGIVKQFNKRMVRPHAANLYAGMVFAFLGFVQPVFKAAPWHGGRAQRVIAKTALLLSLPALLGLGFELYFGQQHFAAPFAKYMNVLIVVMVGGLFIHVITNTVRSFLRHSKVGFLAYLRVALGLIVTFLILFQNGSF